MYSIMFYVLCIYNMLRNYKLQFITRLFSILSINKSLVVMKSFSLDMSNKKIEVTIFTV